KDEHLTVSENLEIKIPIGTERLASIPIRAEDSTALEFQGNNPRHQSPWISNGFTHHILKALYIFFREFKEWSEGWRAFYRSQRNFNLHQFARRHHTIPHQCSKTYRHIYTKGDQVGLFSLVRRDHSRETRPYRVVPSNDGRLKIQEWTLTMYRPN
ncbi:Hypothetical protein FKW44_021553, partial [Caligus rogercresseyi]